MKKIGLLFSALMLGVFANAQTVSITSGNLTYTQNLNTLDTSSATSSAVLPQGWSIFEYGTSTSANNQYKGGNGSSNAGETYSLGSSGSTERGLGSLASNSLNAHYGVKFQNNTGAAITSFTISYVGEQWRMGTTGRTNTDSLRFLYSTTASNVSDTAAANWNENLSLMFNTPNMAATSGAIDGNLAINRTTKTATVNVNIPAGGTLVIKWVDVNISGSDDALGLDDLSITFVGAGGPVNVRPTITALSPLNNATNVAAGANLQITFNKPVTKGATGNIVIRNQTDMTMLIKPTASGDVTVSGAVATIANTGLAVGKTYWIGVDSNAFDSAGYRFVGIYDSTSWKFTTVPPPNYRPTITPVSPVDNANSLPANAAATLRMAFSRRVTKGTTGNINVKNETDGTTTTKAVTSADVTLNASGDTASIANVALVAGKSYHVLVDSIAFDTAGYRSMGIVDTTRWNFSVQGPVVTVTGLSEKFDNSCPAGLPAGWLQYSVTGPSQFWKCSGTGPNYNLVMNGGGSASSTANEDWLITPRLNLIGMINTLLTFKTRFRFAGPDMEVKYSTNYAGAGDPNAATWSDIQGIAFSTADSGNWVTKSAALDPSAPLFVAFKYTSATATPSNGREWSVDSVYVTGTVGVTTVRSQSGIPVSVLGTATNGQVTIGFDLQQEAAMQVGIYDLAGREVYTENIRAAKGHNSVVLTPQSLQSGMYIIRINTGAEYGVARTFIQ